MPDAPYYVLRGVTTAIVEEHIMIHCKNCGVELAEEDGYTRAVQKAISSALIRRK